MKRRLMSFVLAAVMVITMLPGMATRSKAATDYSTWKQTDSAWNQEAAWPQAPWPYMRQAGCWITSVALLLRHYGIVSPDNTAFNPWTCNQELMRVGAVNIVGDMVDLGKIANAYPGFTYYDCDWSYSFSELKQKFDAGYACMVEVYNHNTGNNHMVAVRHVSDTVVTIMDPGYSYTDLNEYGTKLRFISFGPFDVVPTSPDYLYQDNSTNGPDTLSLSGATYPTSLSVGQWFSLQGTVKSGRSSITSLTAGVYNSSGKMVTGKTVEPKAKSYNIHNLDNDVLFDSLSSGTYSYIIRATNANGTKELLNKSFTVGSGSSSDTLSLSGETYPTSLSVGQWFALKGTVTSSASNITSLTAGAFDSAGNMETGNTVFPNAKSYNIVNIDPDVHFDWLPAGTYSYIIRATNAGGTKELLNKTFTVGGGSSGSGSTIDASGRYSVTNTRNITGQDIVATARQWANKGATYWSHYDPWLPSIYWRTGYTYSGQTSFDCSGFVSRVLNDCGLRSGNYTPPYGDCILSQQYGNGFMSIQIEDLINYGTDITAAVKRAKNGDYSGLQPGDLIAWTSGSLGRHIIIYAGMKNGTPWTVEFTGNGYRDRAMPAEYQSAFQFGARLVSDAGAACSEHTKGEFLFYEGAHPHYNYYTCATCGEKFSDWSTTALSDCDTCSPICLNHTKGSFAYCEVDTHPHYNWYKCTECGKEFQDDTTQKVDNCKDCEEVGVVNCVRTFSFPAHTIPVYDRAAGIVVANVNWKNYIAICDQYVQLSDGTIRYRIAEGPKGSVGLWFSKVTGIEEINAVHQFGATTYDDTHPHLAQKVCPCGYVETWIPDNYHDPACKLCNTTEATPSDFAVSDVSPEQWYYNAIQYVMKNGIMSGYNATTFGPNDNLSRAMVVQVLYNKEGQPAVSGKHKFPDVPYSQWYNNAVTWGSQRGVVGGYGDGRFGPDDSVTLEQVAVILWNYSKNPAGTGSLNGIKGQYSDWAANALRWCAGKGILNNVPYSNATEKATRAQTAQMLKNFLE